MTAVAVAVFLVTYAVIVSERLHRTTVVLLGAVVMIVLDIEGYGQEEAFHAIDFNVIFLLVGMMVIVHSLSKTGVFQWLAIRSAKVARGNALALLVILSTVTAVLSAFLDNVTTVVLIAPVTLFLADSLDVPPTPLLVAQAIASNIGGAATLVGDPPNILIGSSADLTFVDFLVNMLPAVLVIGVLSLAYLAWRSRRVLVADPVARERTLALDESRVISDRRLLRRSLPVLGLTIVGFVLHGALGLEPATIALGGAAVLLMVTGADPHELLREVEWSTIFFFVGLFVLVGGLESVGVLEDVGRWVSDQAGGSETTATLLLLWVSGILSGLVDNIPYTAAVIPVAHEIKAETGAGDVVWWSLALGADLGGNLTLIGASANILVANLALRGGRPIGFWEFMRAGVPVTLVSLALSTLYLWLRYLV